MSAERGAATFDVDSAWSRFVPSMRSHSVVASGSAGSVAMAPSYAASTAGPRARRRPSRAATIGR